MIIHTIIDNSWMQQRTDRHVLGGVVKLNGAPAKKLLVVTERDTLAYVASIFSDQTTGEWKITNINEYPVQSLSVTVYDSIRESNAGIIDYVSQVAG